MYRVLCTVWVISSLKIEIKALLLNFLIVLLFCLNSISIKFWTKNSCITSIKDKRIFWTSMHQLMIQYSCRLTGTATLNRHSSNFLYRAKIEEFESGWRWIRISCENKTEAELRSLDKCERGVVRDVVPVFSWCDDLANVMFGWYFISIWWLFDTVLSSENWKPTQFIGSEEKIRHGQTISDSFTTT